MVTGTGSAGGVVLAPSLLEFKGHLDDALRHMVRFRWSCKEQGVGLHDPYGSLATQNILWCFHAA